MTRRRKIGTFGLSMLDIVSNSLAAVIILFFILSTLRVPSIPIERICGTGKVEIVLYENKKLEKNTKIKADIYVMANAGDHGDSPANMSLIKDSIYWSENVIDFDNYYANNLRNVTFECDPGNQIDHPQSITITNELDIHGEPLEALKTVTFKNPPRNLEFEIGIIYSDHLEIDLEKKPIKANITCIWQHEANQVTADTTITFEAPTNRRFIVVDWGKIQNQIN